VRAQGKKKNGLVRTAQREKKKKTGLPSAGREKGKKKNSSMRGKKEGGKGEGVYQMKSRSRKKEKEDRQNAFPRPRGRKARNWPITSSVRKKKKKKRGRRAALVDSRGSGKAHFRGEKIHPNGKKSLRLKEGAGTLAQERGENSRGGEEVWSEGGERKGGSCRVRHEGEVLFPNEKRGGG